MKVQHPDDRIYGKAGSVLKRTAGFLAVLAVFLLVHVPEAGSSARSVRTGIQPKGARMVIDLERPTTYSISREGSILRVQVDSGMDARESGQFPANRIASTFSAVPDNGGTLIIIELKVPSVSVEHFTLPSPDRIVIDLNPPGKDPAPEITALHGLIPAPATHGPGPHSSVLKLPREDVTIGDGFSARSFSFDIPPLWKIRQGSSLNLNLETGGMGKNALLTILLVMNGSPVKTLVLESAKGSPGAIPIPLSPHLFKVGKNVLTIGASIDSKDRHQKSGGENLGIRDRSFLRLNFLPANDLRIKDMASPFEASVIKPGEGVAAVLPDRPEPAEIEAALVILLSWAGKAGDEAFSPRIIFQEELDNRTADSFHLVYLGRTSSLPAKVLEAFGSGGNEGPGSSLSSFLNVQGKARLLVTSGTAEGVLSGARSLLDPDLSEKMDSGKVLLGPGTVHEERVTYKTREDILFGRLFGGDILFSGTGSQEKRSLVALPPEGAVKGKPELVLDYRYSPVLDNTKSTLTVELGDAAASTVPLGKRSSGEGRLVVEVPRSLLGAGPFDIRFRISLETAGEEKAKGLEDAAWLLIDSASRFELSAGKGDLAPLFENLPHAFPGREISIFAGPGTRGEHLAALVRMLIDWNRYLASDLRVKVKSLSSFSRDEPEGSSIITGALGDIVRSGAPLAVGYEEASGRISSGPKVRVRKEHELGSVYLQVLGTRDRGTALLIGWPPERSGDGIFTGSIRFSSLRGDVNLISPNGEVASYYVNTPEPGESFLRSRPGLRIFLGLFAMGLSLALLALFVYHIRLKYPPRPPADGPGG